MRAFSIKNDPRGERIYCNIFSAHHCDLLLGSSLLNFADIRRKKEKI